MGARRVLITGASGYLGAHLVAALHADQKVDVVVATDIRVPQAPVPGVIYEFLDVRDASRLSGLLADYRIDTLVHLAWDGGQWGGDDYAVDVLGSRHVLAAAAEREIARVVLASSDDVYGYWPGRQSPLDETTEVRPNPDFIDAQHKSLLEEAAAAFRVDAPDASLTILRFAAVLGPDARNGLLALLGLPEFFAETGEVSALSVVHLGDAIGVLTEAVTSDTCGTFNVAAEGQVSLSEAAAMLNKKLHTGSLRSLQRRVRKLGQRTFFDAELLPLLIYRPVLDTTALRGAFKHAPVLAATEAFKGSLTS